MTLYQFFYGEASINHQLFMLINHASNPLFDVAMPFFTSLANAESIYFYPIVLVLLSLISRALMPWKYLGVFVLGSLFALVLEWSLKGFFHVPRPATAIGIEHVRVLGELKLHNSLPSGHSIFAFMVAYVLSYGRNTYWKIAFFAVASLVAYSRIYVGAHYPLDVATGALIGMGAGYLAWKLYEEINANQRP